MASLKQADRMTTFRTIDAYTVEAFRIAASMRRSVEAGELSAEIRRCAARTGAAVVAGAALERGTAAERRCYEQARASLAEGRYYLYLARRFGLIDSRSYRAAGLRLDAAMRELVEAGSTGSAGELESRVGG